MPLNAKYFVAIALISVQPFRLFCQSSPEYRPIDQLARSITVNCRTEKQKVDSVVHWVANYLTYDRVAYEQYRQGIFSPATIETVLHTKKAVCEGYALLTEELLKNAGIEAVTITGLGKSSAIDLFDDTMMLAHGWNAVKLNNKWELLDVTWTDIDMEAGDSSMFFCYTDPGKFIWSHYPTDLQWSFVAGPPTLQEFLSRPLTYWDVFAKYGLQIPQISHLIEKNITTTAESIFIENIISENYDVRVSLQDIDEEGFTQAEITYIDQPKKGWKIMLPKPGIYQLDVNLLVHPSSNVYELPTIITAKVVRTKN